MYTATCDVQPLLVSCAALTGAALAVAAWGASGGAAGAGESVGAGVVVPAAISVAVAADAAGLQPAPYALLADMFHYQVNILLLLSVYRFLCINYCAILRISTICR